MQDQNISPNPELQPEAKPGQSTSDTSVAPKKSKKKTQILIVGGFVALIGIIIGACIATNGINDNKITPGFGHYDKPQLKKDQILIGFEDKYFFTGNNYSDTAKNITKVFSLFQYDNASGKIDKKVENLDALLRKHPDHTKGQYGAETYILSEKKTSTSNGLTAFKLTGIYNLDISEDEATFGEQDYEIRVSCSATSEFAYEVDDMSLICNKTSEEEVNKYLEELGDAIKTDSYNNKIYKNHKINFLFNRSKKTLETIVISSKQHEEKLIIEEE